VNHSSYVDMIGNVAFNVRGAAFVTEVGDEIGSFRANLAMGGSGSGESAEARKRIQDFGHRGDGFWFQGAGITVTDNIAAGNTGSAFAYFVRALVENGVKKEFLVANLPDPSLAGDRETIDVGSMAVFSFENNVGYASREGLSAWYLMENADPGLHSLLQDSTFWNNTTGIHLPYTRQTVLRNVAVIHAPQEERPATGVRGNLITRDIAFLNLTVSGYQTALDLPHGNVVVLGANFSNNVRDIEIQLRTDRSALIAGLEQVPRIVMAVNPNLVSGNNHFRDNVVILNFGDFRNQRLYYVQQQADHVPFPTVRDDIPAAYVGLTNRQLWDVYGVALGGAIAPDDAYTTPHFVGLLGPIT
jgi:hypothetical protein